MTPETTPETTAGTAPETTRRTADVVFTVALLVIFVAALLLARQWSFRASLVPTLFSAVGIGLSAVHLVTLYAGRNRAPAPVAVDPEIEEHDPAHVFATAGAADWRSCLAWAAGFFAGVYVAGLLVATVVFTAAYMRLNVRAGWRASALYALALGLALWLGLDQLLAIQLPEGLFG
jgi:Tripartite tricarboxylate transporter TctB family